MIQTIIFTGEHGNPLSACNEAAHAANNFLRDNHIEREQFISLKAVYRRHFDLDFADGGYSECVVTVVVDVPAPLEVPSPWESRSVS